MTAVGDQWREFAVMASRCFKNRDKGQITYDQLADILLNIADREEKIFMQLRKVSLT
jgi:hypothetical protein